MDATREHIRQTMDAGSFSDAEDYINDGPWEDDVKAALWLYAWSLQSPQHQQAEAGVLLALVAG